MKKRTRNIIWGWPVIATLVTAAIAFLLLFFGEKGCDGGACLAVFILIPASFNVFFIVGLIHAFIDSKIMSKK